MIQNNQNVTGRLKWDCNINIISCSFSADALKAHQSPRLPFLGSHHCNCGDSQLMTVSCPWVWILLHKKLYIHNSIYKYINHTVYNYKHREVTQKCYLYTHTYLHIYMCMCVIIHTGMHAYERRWVYANVFTSLAFSFLFPLPPLSVQMLNSQHQQGCPQQWPKIHSAGYLFVC